MMRTAISPRFAIKILRTMSVVSHQSISHQSIVVSLQSIVDSLESIVVSLESWSSVDDLRRQPTGELRLMTDD